MSYSPKHAGRGTPTPILCSDGLQVSQRVRMRRVVSINRTQGRFFKGDLRLAVRTKMSRIYPAVDKKHIGTVDHMKSSETGVLGNGLSNH